MADSAPSDWGKSREAVRVLRRTDAILAAIRRELEAYRAVVDLGEDIGCVTLTVRLHAGTSDVKSTMFAAERPRPRLAGRG